MGRLTIKRPRRSDIGVPRKLYGKVVLDARQPFTFDISKRDCQRGSMNNHESCAAALALCRQVPNVVAVHVGRANTIVEFQDRCVRFKTPRALRDQTIRFDASQQFDPGQYKLLAMTEAAIKNRGGRTGAKPKYGHARDNPNRVPRETRKVGRPSLMSGAGHNMRD